MRVYLVRHGQVAANREMRYVGKRDEPLTEEGRGQARALGLAFREVQLDRVLVSPRRRAVDTAQELLSKHPRGCDLMEVEQRLAEQDFGEWEGLSREEILSQNEESRRQLEAFDKSFESAPPGGESFVDLATRSRAVLEQAAREGVERLAVVSHVGPTKALLAMTLGLGLVDVRRFFLDPGTFTVVDWRRGGVLRLFNAPGHREWLASRWMKGHRLGDQ